MHQSGSMPAGAGVCCNSHGGKQHTATELRAGEYMNPAIRSSCWCTACCRSWMLCSARSKRFSMITSVSSVSSRAASALSAAPLHRTSPLLFRVTHTCCQETKATCNLNCVSVKVSASTTGYDNPTDASTHQQRRENVSGRTQGVVINQVHTESLSTGRHVQSSSHHHRSHRPVF
jgi:hypothetical protein